MLPVSNMAMTISSASLGGSGGSDSALRRAPGFDFIDTKIYVLIDKKKFQGTRFAELVAEKEFLA